MWKLLVAVDGSDRSLGAVAHALELARKGLPVHLVLAHVQEPASLYELVTSRDPNLIAAASQAAGAHILQTAMDRVTAAGVPFDVVVEMGDPAQTLVELAQLQQCDGVVVGARGQGALRSALLGSVSQALARTSPVPVTIVRIDQDLEEAFEDEEDSALEP